MKLDTYLYTNQGDREHNEDSAAFLEKNGHGIYVVADGLGGHLHGEMASGCVKDVLIEGWSPNMGQEDRAKHLQMQIAKANQMLLELQKEQHCIMKSTVVALAIDKNCAVWAHTGDSRLYYFHRNALWDITEDHSVSYRKYKTGEIARTEISRDEDQSRLLRTIGSEERYEPDLCILEERLEPGDGFLLCTDGVWEYLYDEEILIDLLKSETAKEWAELLLLRMITRIGPGNDNLTLLTVLLQE